MLSKILQTPDDDLEALRADKLAESTNADVGQLRTARAILLAVCRALDSGDEALWHELETARGRVTQQHSSSQQGAAGDAAAKGGAAPIRGKLEPLAGLAQTAPLTNKPRQHATLPFAVPMQGPAPDPTLPASEVLVSVGGASLSLRHHAEMCAAHARAPHEWNSILARYGFAHHDAFAALDVAWRKRLTEDAELDRLWKEVYRLALQGS